MRREMSVKLKKIADKVTEGSNLEKSTWKDLDAIEFDVVKMKAEIDHAVDEIVS